MQVSGRLFPALKRWAKLGRPLRGWILAGIVATRKNEACLDFVMVNALCCARLSRELGRVALREFRMDAKPRPPAKSRALIRKKRARNANDWEPSVGGRRQGHDEVSITKDCDWDHQRRRSSGVLILG